MFLSLAVSSALLLSHLSLVLSLPATTSSPLSLTITGNITLSSNTTNLSAPPPPNFHIDGQSLFLPHKYRISFEHYGPPIPLSAASQCLEKAALEYHQNREMDLMGVAQRTYGSEGVVLGIKPEPRLIWGYWGAAIRAVDSMWLSWDAVALEFVIGVQEEGVLGRGFLTSVGSTS